MALSNWDTLAVDETGAPIEGASFASDNGLVKVAFYKNWLQVSSAQMWSDGGGFVSPVIATIQEGELRIGNLEILAVRGPQSGIYACVQQLVRDSAGYRRRGMVGCSCYGFMDQSDLWVGITDAEVNFLRGFMLQRLEAPFRDINLAGAVRFNQGDAFFAGEFGVEAPRSAPGESGTPILLDALKGLEKPDPQD